MLLLGIELYPLNLKSFPFAPLRKRGMQAPCRQDSPDRREGRVPRPLFPSHQLIWREGATESTEGRAEATLTTVTERAAVPILQVPVKMLSERESDSSHTAICSFQGSEPELQDTSVCMALSTNSSLVRGTFISSLCVINSSFVYMQGWPPCAISVKVQTMTQIFSSHSLSYSSFQKKVG